MRRYNYRVYIYKKENKNKKFFRKENKPMKKSIKILTLVLALALVCGALVIGVVAKTAYDYDGADGVYVVTGADLESAKTTIHIQADDGTSNKTTWLQGTGASQKNSLSADIINRLYGDLKIVQSTYDGNKYVYFTAQPDGPTNSAGFLSTGYTGHDVEKNNNNSDTHTYQVFDIDVYFPDGKSVSFTPNMQIRGYKADGTSKLTPGMNLFNIMSDSKEASNVYVKDTNGKVLANLDPTVWTHFTSVVEVIKAEGETTVINLYTFMNGEMIGKASWTGNTNTLLHDSEFWFAEIRCNFGTNHSSDTYLKDASIAVDNVSWFAINPAAYDTLKLAQLEGVLAAGVGGSLAVWSDSLYEADNMPFGSLMATIGEGDDAQYFDNLEKAIAAVSSGDAVTLNASSTAAITINKSITVMKNGFTANLVPLNAGVKLTETDDAYIFEATDVKMTVRVQPCECGEGCFDAKTIEVYKDEVIWEAIVREYGKEISCSYEGGESGEIKYEFDGFIVTDSAAALFDGGKFDKTAVVTDEFNGTTAVISVAYKVNAPIAKVITSAGTLVKYFYAGTGFQDIMNSANGANGRVVVLLADHNTNQANTKYIQKQITLDLNGYTIKHLCVPDATDKKNGTGSDVTKPLIQVQSTSNLTITSSVVGGKIFEAACYKNSNRYSTPFITGTANGAVINFKGTNEAGEITLSFYGSNAVQSYGSQATVNVDGGYYCRNRGDNFALFDMRVLADCTFKNAIMDGQAGSIFAFSGRNSGMGDTTATVTIDNCELINGTVLNYLSDKVTVTFTNSVIGGSITPAVESTATALDGNEIYIGEGCKLKKNITVIDGANIATGENEVEITIADKLTYKVTKNDWTVSTEAKPVDNFALSTKTISVEVDKMIVNEANAKFLYVSGGKTMVANVAKDAEDVEMTFYEVVGKADDKSEIKFYKDVEILTSKNCTSAENNDVAVINNNVTFNLNGYKLEILGTAGSQPTILTNASNKEITFKNGTIVTGYTTKIDGYYQAYALVQAADGMKLNMENCKFYGSAITYSYGAKDCVVNINNSEVYLNAITKGANDTGFINGRRYFDGTIEDTKFYITYSTATLVSVSAGAAGTTDHGEIEFKNCDIVSTTGNRIVKNSSALQDIIFNNCRIYGYLGAPTTTDREVLAKDQQPKLTLGEGTVFNSYADGGFEEGGALEVPEGYVRYNQESSHVISFYASSGQLADGNFTLPDFNGDPNSIETYTFRHVIISKSFLTSYNVNWYDQNGELISSEQVYENTEVTPPTFTPVVASANGWWRQLYDSWSNSQDGEITEDFVITEDSDFYIVKSAPKAHLTAAQFNLTLNGHIVMNFYIPNEMPEGITVTSVTGVQQKLGATINLGGKKYTGYIAAYVGVTSMVSDTVVTVNFTDVIDGETVEFTQNIKISPYRYAKSVLTDYDAGATKYEAKAYTIVANMLRYAKTVNEVNGKTSSTINNLLAPYESRLCASIDSADDGDFPESNMVDLGDLKDYIQSITFEISTYEPRYKVTFKPGSKVVDFHLEAIGYNRTTNGLDMGGINWGYQTYNYSTSYGVYYYDDLGQFVNPKTGNVVTEYGDAVAGATAGTWSDKYIGSVHTQNIPIYNVDEDMTIVITLEDGTVVKGEYNIDTYYNNIKNAKDAEGNAKYTPAQLTAARTFLRAMRTYATAVESYRFPIGKYPYVDTDKVGENGNAVVNATLFGAKPDDGQDDYAALKATFEFANKMGYDVVFPAGTYTIGINTNGAIPIKTNVDFGNATFDLQDNLYTEANTPSASNTSTISTYGTNIFDVVSSYKAVTVTGNLPATIAAGATNIGYAPGYKAHVKIYNQNVKNYVRHGANNTKKVEDQTSMYEVVLVDAEGNVDPTTPILFDYTAVTKMIIRRADEDPIKVEGGTFITNANKMYREYNYVARGINVSRSNVTLEGIEHQVINEGDTGAPYHGFLYVQNCNNVLIKDCTVQAHKYYTRIKETTNNMGTYDIGADCASNLTYENVIQSNFWYDQSSGLTSNTTNGGVWGIGGTNDCKNMWYKGCTLARYDAHRGVVNGGIENSTLAGVSILGGGTFYFRNNKVYSGTTQYIINLREDYGSSWKGDMIFENIEWTCATEPDSALNTKVDLYVISATKTTCHYFGYTCYKPNATFTGSFKVTMTGVRNGLMGITSNATLGTLYAGKFGTGSTDSDCHGCIGTYGSSSSTYDTTTYGKVTKTNYTGTSLSDWKN